MKKIAVIVIVFLFSLFIVGCTKTEDYLKDILIKHSDLIDPNSAMFRKLTYDSSFEKSWCGEIKVKNRMGGYTDWQEFKLSKKDDEFYIHFENDIKAISDKEEINELSNRTWNLLGNCHNAKPASSWVFFWEK